MKFAECIVTFDAEQKIKVGAKGGSGFFYCGTAGDMLCKYTAYSDIIKTGIAEQLSVHRKRMKQLLDNPPEIGRWAARELKKPIPELTHKEFMEYTNFWLRQVAATDRQVHEDEARLLYFAPLAKRRVFECRDADMAIDPFTKIIIIEGDEIGAFWDTNEGKGLGLRGPEVEDESIEAAVGC